MNGIISSVKSWLSQKFVGGKWTNAPTSATERDLLNVNVGNESPVSVSMAGLLEGVRYDDVQITYPTSTTEEFEFLYLTVSQKTIELTYSNSSKKDLTRARAI